MSTEVRVQIDIAGACVHVGDLTFETNAGGALLATTFRYTSTWVEHPSAYALCPELPLGTGPQRSAGARPVPGAVADTGPDRWGRTLLFDAARREARQAGGPLPSFTEADFVLLADDRTRIGALRYLDASGTPLAPPRDHLPTLVDLERLVHAARQATAHEEPDDADLRLLVAGGTTMGGARPKVSVMLPSGRLGLAKLPSADDRWDVQAWEMTTLELARAAGIRVPAATHHRTGPETSVIVLDRFDRPAEGGRTGFMSADSLLEKRVDEVVSYVDLVDALGDVAQEARTERLELFRRVAFVLLVNDVDDHMKNHALLRGRIGWRLSPSYDVNPWPRSWLAESTPVAPGGVRTARSVEELVEQAAAFGLTTDEAVGVVVDVDEATRPWARVAEHHGVEDPADSVLASAFEGPDRALVARWRR